MNQFGVILALLFSMIIALFAIANNEPIVVNYLYGRTEVSAVIVIIGSAILGALVVFLLSIFRQVRTGLMMRGLRQEINNLQEKIQEIEVERDSLLVQIGQLQKTGEEAGEETSKDDPFDVGDVDDVSSSPEELPVEGKPYMETSYENEPLTESKSEKIDEPTAEDHEKKEDDIS